MVKKRYFSAHSNFKTGIMYKIFFILGFILLIIYLMDLFLHFFEPGESVSGVLLALSILFIGGSFLLFFVSCQFAKLAKIADEIEKENNENFE